MMTGVIIQATMGSNGVPLTEIGKWPLLGHIFARLDNFSEPPVKKDDPPVKKVVATSVRTEDDAIEEYCEANEVEYFRGNAENAFERFYLCAVEQCFSDVVALKADCPFPDIEELSRLLELHRSTGADYSHSFGSLPAGVGAEVYSFETLRKIARKASRPKHFSAVNGYILDKPHLFKISVLEVPEAKRRPALSLTVETEEDLQRARFILESAGGEVTTEEAIEICSKTA
ncbi:MAG: hypothetical protein BMS9Abin24_096 [Thermodesulfobacteriota bacterium]|nr:MAG: hypothetical protein BMS9Abin24_096 [Thermodesulfobacteriota bacterium]